MFLEPGRLKYMNTMNVTVTAQGTNGFGVPFINVQFDAILPRWTEERAYQGVLSSPDQIYVSRLGDGYGYHVGYVSRESEANVPANVAAELRKLFV